MHMNRRQALTGLAATAAVTVFAGPARGLAAPAATAAPAGATGSGLFPTVIPLPDNWLPEGIAIGGRPFAYFGSRADGSIYRANLITGEGAPLPVPGPGTPAVGLKIDHRGRLFVAGGTAGSGRVVDASTGEIIVNYPFTTETSFVNDVVLTPWAAYFTDSRSAVLFVVPFGRGGSLPPPDRFVRLPLAGPDLEIVPGATNLNGIARTPDGRALLVIQSNTGELFRVNPRTGAATLVDLGGESLPNGDGLLLDGRTLYVVQNRLNLVAVLRMSRDGRSGRVLGRVGSEDFDVPTTVAKFGNRLYLPNARFGAVPPATTFTAVAIPVPRF
jgi:sugar lactone lactonase YvrE